ncbi:MAG TPA: hemerythrin domain-containing protein [Sedimenticola sp.]|nr:hemerythrin domain-containing protein [Sedimenticola sp.]
MSSITETMTADHRHCDEIFARAEELVANRDWEQATTRYGEFRDAMEHHFSMEEEALFPRFEARVGNAMGPTQVMRMEHIQMRKLFDDMGEAVQQQDRDRYLGLSETLMMLMQQHNMKEEQMLYPMTDQVFGGEAADVLGEMDQV